MLTNLLAIQVSRKAVKKEGEGILTALFSDVAQLVSTASECSFSDYTCAGSIADFMYGADIIICIDEVMGFVPLLTDGEPDPFLVANHHATLQKCVNTIAENFGYRTLLVMRTRPWTFSVTSA